MFGRGWRRKSGGKLRISWRPQLTMGGLGLKPLKTSRWISTLQARSSGLLGTTQGFRGNMSYGKFLKIHVSNCLPDPGAFDLCLHTFPDEAELCNRVAKP